MSLLYHFFHRVSTVNIKPWLSYNILSKSREMQDSRCFLGHRGVGFPPYKSALLLNDPDTRFVLSAENFAFGEYTRPLRLTSELVDLRVGDANSPTFAFGYGGGVRSTTDRQKQKDTTYGVLLLLVSQYKAKSNFIKRNLLKWNS